jgi:MOSC domain-containing protein YiiM
MTVTNLFVKRAHGAALRSVATIAYDDRGIQNNVVCAPFRQVLIASRSVTAECGLSAGDLRENVVVDFDSLYELPSGTVVQIGRALVRLTFHCEPCSKILKLVEFDRILHRRGVFGMFLNHGTISIGDRFSVTEQRFEEIPYAVSDRVRWFLKKGNPSGAAMDLVHAIGLPVSYARAMPNLLRKFSRSRTNSKFRFGE